MYKVKDVAAISGVSVRTLHYYDQIGLLRPCRHSEAGYRLYSDAELATLQQILFFKEMGFGLEDIRDILGCPGFDQKEALQAHLVLLQQQKDRLDALMQAVRKTLASMEGECVMSKEEMFGAFDMGEIKRHQEKYAEEVKQKYGKTGEASQQKTSSYTEQDWKRVSGEMEAIYGRFIGAMERGPSDPKAQEAARLLREHITRHYYDCKLEIFRGLGDLYVDDPRFTANIDQYRPGLAAFMKEAMQLYCDRAGG